MLAMERFRGRVSIRLPVRLPSYQVTSILPGNSTGNSYQVTRSS
jgi:hypothetical protein